MHPLQDPLSQTRFVPHDVPFATGVPVSLHVCTPVLQSVTPTSQAFAGVQESPAEQALHAPLSQTRFVPHGVPFATGVVLATHCEVPVEQLVVATWQGSVGTVHETPAVHALQTPPLQTSFAPQVVPFSFAVPSVQTEVPVEQLVTPS